MMVSSFHTGEMILIINTCTVWVVVPEELTLLTRPWRGQPFENTIQKYDALKVWTGCRGKILVMSVSMLYIHQELLNTQGLKYIFRGTWDVLLQMLLFTSSMWRQSHWKIISKSGTRPSWPFVNVKLTHFIFSHLPFSVHTSAISARSLLTASVWDDRVYLGWELMWCGAGYAVQPKTKKSSQKLI